MTRVQPRVYFRSDTSFQVFDRCCVAKEKEERPLFSCEERYTVRHMQKQGLLFIALWLLVLDKCA